MFKACDASRHSMPRLLLVAALAFLGAGLGAASAMAAQASPELILLGPNNLIVNPNFDTGLSGWTPVGKVTWSGTEDETGMIGKSGSADLLSGAGRGQGSELVQCVNLPVDWQSLGLEFSFSNFTTGTGANGMGFVALSYSDELSCAGTQLTVAELVAQSTGGIWLASSTQITPPPLTKSIAVDLVSTNVIPNSPTDVFFDSIFLGPTRKLGACGQDSSLLCVDEGRFKITAQFTQTCGSGTGLASGVQITPDGGYLWCFDPGNPEIFVKVINACNAAVGDTYWVFISGLTNVGVTVTVTDSQTNQHKSYVNPNGTAFVSIEDTSGLKVCP